MEHCHLKLAGRHFVIQQLHLCVIPYNGGRNAKHTRQFFYKLETQLKNPQNTENPTPKKQQRKKRKYKELILGLGDFHIS